MLDTVPLPQPRPSGGAAPPPPDGPPPAPPISRPILAMAAQLIDFALLLGAGLAATRGYEAVLNAMPAGDLAVATLISAGATVLAVRHGGGYALPRLGQLRRSVLGTALPLLIGWTAAVVSLFMLREGAMPSRAWPFAFAGASCALLAAHRALLRVLIGRWRRSGRLVQRIAVVGVNDFSETFLQRLAAQPDSFLVTGVYDDRQSRIPPHLHHVAVRGGVDALLRDSREERIDTVVIALSLAAADRINEILARLGSLVVDVFLTTDIAGLRYEGAQFAAIGSNPVVSVGERPLKDWQAMKKAAFDRAVGGALLLAAAVPLLAVAAIVRLDSPGPALFRQPRVGFDNRMFSIYKFRTMHAHMADLLADRQTTRDDPRVTRVGRWLRRFSIDELPQLINVMQGTMSLVGPRPHAPNTKAADKLFADVVGQYAVRHRVKPGITGWAQVNGWRGETKTEEQVRSRVRFDLDYIQNWSLGLDLKILALTLFREVHSATAF
jgi:Undecaprenyl-phosphate glucose phosphotransferase